MSLKDSIRYTSGKRKLRLWSSGNIAPDERTEASQCETTKISARGRGFFERGGGWIFFFFQTIENSLVEKQVTFCTPPRRKSKSINYLRVETMFSILLYSW